MQRRFYHTVNRIQGVNAVDSIFFCAASHTLLRPVPKLRGYGITHTIAVVAACSSR